MNGLPNPFVPDSATFADAAVTLRPAPSPGVTVALTPDPVHPCRDNSAASPANNSEAAAFSSDCASLIANTGDVATGLLGSPSKKNQALIESSCGTKEREGASCDQEATGGGSNPRRESGRRDGKNPRARVGVAPNPHEEIRTALIPAMIANVLRMRSLPYSNANRFDQYFDEPAFVRALGGET